MKVLITDAHSKQAYTVMRSLAKHGVNVSLASFNKFAPASASRFCHRNFISPSYSEKERYIDFLLERVRETHHDLLIPCDDISVIYLSEARNRFEPYVHFVLPDHPIVEIAAYKDNLMNFAKANGIPIPKSFCPKRLEEYEMLAEQLEGEIVVVKGVRGAGARQIRYAPKGNILEAVKAILNTGASHNPRLPILQEYLPGRNMTVYVLCDKGKLLASVPFRQLRMYPSTGGIPAKTITAREPQVETLATRLAKALGWHGVAGFAFRQDARDGQFKLLEINPRFGGSTQTALAGDVDLPLLFWNYFVEKKSVPFTVARPGRKYRSIFPDGFLHFLARPSSLPSQLIDCFNFRTDYGWNPFEWKVVYRQMKGTWWELQDRLSSGSLRYPCGQISKQSSKSPHHSRQKRRILYVDAGSGSGGSAVSLLRLLEKLNKNRWEPVVMVHQGGKATEKILEMGIPVYPLPLRPEAVDRGLLKNLFEFYIPLFFRLLRELREIKPDLVHLNNSPRTPFVAILAASLLRIPVVSHLRVVRPLTGFERLLARLLKKLIVISRSSETICQRQGVSQERLRYIPDGFEMGTIDSLSRREEARRKLGILDGEPLIGVVGRLMPFKGQEKFIEVIGQVLQHYPHAKAVIVGDECEKPSQYLSHLKGLVASRHLSGRIQFTGWVENPGILYPAFDILAQTSLLPEGFSLVCLEAMAHGIPVVSTRVGAIPELVEEGVTGFLVSPGDPNAFASALLRLLKEAPLRQKMGEAGKARARSCFDIQRTVADTEALYEEVVKS